MNTLVIEKSALKNNISRIKELAGSAYVYANLSGDGQGLGAAPLALLLRDEGVSRFAVDSVESAQAVRKAGLVDEEILMLRSLTDRAALEQLADLNVICSVGSLEAGMALNAVAENRSTVIEAHLEIDSGMGFGGFPAEEPEKIVTVVHNLPNVAFSGVYTQLASTKALSAQLELFQKAVDALRAAGCETGLVHAAGSFALLHSDLTHLDAVRAGSALLGRCQRTRGDGLTLVGYGEAAVESVRWLPAGHTVGNEKHKTLRKPTRTAVIPVGYQNGFGVESPAAGLWEALRRLRRQRRRTVRINGQRARVLGSVGASQILVNVTSLKCSEGDLATFDIEPLFARGFRREFR